MLKLAVEWGKVEKILPRVESLPGARHRDRVLSTTEEEAYLQAAAANGDAILEGYRKALLGIRSTMRDEKPIEPEDPYRLRDVATLLIDCGLRPE